MSQNNPASWTNNEWKFSYEIPEQESGLPGQLSPVGDRQQSPLDMLGAFGEALFSGIFDTLGNIFNGVIEVGGAIAGGLIEGIKGLVGWVGSTIASLFSGGEPRVPPPPIYSEISTDLEGDIKPFVDAFKESQEKAFQAVADAKALRELFDENQKIVSDRIDEADDKIQQVGDVDAKISAEAARILAEVEIHKAATEEALGKAETVREDLAEYKVAADAKIQSALADAKAGLDKLDVLEPRVSSVISDLEAYEEATNAKIQDLLGKASGAITDAGQALTQYDDLLGEYEGFKAEASGSLEALRKSSTTQGQKLGVIEDDMPGIKTSITNVFALAETAQSTVDNLQIGGRNLARRRNLAGNSSYQTIVDTGETFWTGEPIYYGEKLSSGTPPTSLHRSIRIEPGETYTVSMWIRGETDSGKTNANILFYDTGLLQSYASTRTGDPASEWHLISGTVHNDTDAAYEKVIPYFYINRNPGDKTWFTSPKLERGNKATDWTPAPEDVEAEIQAAQEKADQATLDAEQKAEDARIAAEKYAKEKSEADVALAEERAAAEAARVAKAEADAAKTAAATDATNKANEAERLAKIHADAQADAAQEAAEATAALDATTKANKAKIDAEKEAKRLSDIAAAAAATAQFTANQAKADAESKAKAAREAAEKYAKEKSEADSAQALVAATAEAARVAQEAAAQAVLDSASDADDKVALAEAALKAYADAQADAAQEAAEATAALDATTKANKAKIDAEANAKKLSDAAAASAAAAQSTANQAKLDATNKAAAAQTAAQNYAKEKAEAERAIAEENAAAEALRVAKLQADAAKTAAATDAKAKADEAERLAKLHADAQAALAKEQAEATAALDATTKADKAKKDAEANAKKLSDKAQKLAEEVKFTADTTAGKIPGMQDAITTAHSKAEAAEEYARSVSDRGDNLVPNGFGELGSGKFFDNFTYIPDDAPAGIRGSFEPKPAGGSGFGEIAPIDPFRVLTVSMWAKKLTVNQRIYFALDPMDADGYMISPQHWQEEEGTRTKLTKALNPGDTTVHVESTENWARKHTGSGILNIWNYVDGAGKSWPPGTYSRNNATAQFVTEGIGDKVITLKSPWNGDPVESGTAVGLGSYGGTYLYPINVMVTHDDWQYYEGTIGGDLAEGKTVTGRFPAATVAVRPRILLTPVAGKVRVAGLSLSYTATLRREIEASVQTSADALNTYRTSNDKAVSDANDAAAAAAGVAQTKGEVIYQSTAPTGARATKANLWIRTSDNKPHTYNGSKWVEVTDKVATDAADKAATALSTAQEKTTTYYGSATPSGTKTEGDLWLDSGSDNALKRWSGSAWVVVRDGQLAKALKAAGDAQSTADGKVRSFARSTAPTGMTATDVGDIWLDTDDGNKMYRWSGTSWVTMQDHLAVQAKSVADTATTKAETAQSTVDNLQIGGRNLLLGSQPYFSKDDVYEVESYTLTMSPEDGELVTITIYGSLPEGRAGWGIYNSGTGGGNHQGMARLISPGVYSLTFTWKSANSDTYVRIYSASSSVQAADNPGIVRLDRVKLERGNKATDWTPAPEDVDKSIADVDYKATETGKLIPGMQDAITVAHGKAEEAQTNLDNLQIGGRNLLLGPAMPDRNGAAPGITTEMTPEGLKIVAEPVNTNYVSFTRSELGLSPAGDSLKDGEIVTFSVEIKSEDSTIAPRFYAKAHMSYRQLIGTVGPEFTRVYWTRAWVRDGAWSPHMGFQYSPGTYIVRNFKLERGSKATDWSPAPETVEAEIQAQASALAGYQLSNDTAVDAAKKAAQDAAGLAGGKGEVIYSTTTPPTSKRSAANLWIKGPKNTPHVWNGSAWVEITDQAAKDAAKAAADANELAETKTTTYYQTSAPAASKSVVGDLWIDQSTAGKNALKRWSGSAWVVVQDKAIQEALTAAGTAQSTADEKVRTFSRTTAPTGMKSEHVGDLWIDTDDGNKLYRWSGSAWVGVQDAAIAAAQKAADDAAESQRIKDTRNDNEPPSYYWENYKRTTVREFKYLATVGAGTSGYGVMTTVVPWHDASGGAITQEFNVNNSDTVMHRRSAGSAATATWTEWKNRAKDLADSITTLGTDLATKTGPNSTLQTNISKLEKATDDQYKKLNNDLWGDQGELNKLNSLLWDDQGRLNQATEIFKSNITGWKKDVYNAFIDFDKTNKHQDGLVAANNRAISANTEAVAANTRVLNLVFPAQSAVPMVPGGVRNGGTDAKPVFENMPAWLEACTRVTSGLPTGVNVSAYHTGSYNVVMMNHKNRVQVDPNIEYKYSAWVKASRLSDMNVGFRDQDNAYAIKSTKADPGSLVDHSQTSDLFWVKNIPSGWKQISGTVTFHSKVREVFIDKVTFNHTSGTNTNAAQWLADIQITPNMPAQSEVNRLNDEVNEAQNETLRNLTQLSRLSFPHTNLIPHGSDGRPRWAKGLLIHNTRPDGLPGGWGLNVYIVDAYATETEEDALITHIEGMDYRLRIWTRRVSGSSDGCTFRLYDEKGNLCITHTRNLQTTGSDWVTATMATVSSGGVGVWRYHDLAIRVAPGVKTLRVQYNTNSGSTIGIYDGRLSAFFPLQEEVDSAQNTAIAGNKQSIDALERTVRLAFPHINTLPYSGGNPLWQSRASWITRSTAAANLPPASQRTETFSSLINGSGAMTRNAASSVAIPDDVSELRVRGLLRRDGGFFPIVDLHNDAGASIISAWRRTFPTDDEVSLSGRSEIWYTASSAGGYPVDGNNTDPWQPFDIVIRVKPGSNNFHIRLSSTRLLAIHGLAVFSYYPSQSEVDFAQDRAMRALSGSVDLATSIGTAAATAAENLGAAQTAMQMSLVTTASYIPRVMIINDLGHRSAHERSEHVQVRKDGSSSFLIDARGSSWTGLIVVTTFYGSSLVTDTFEITPGGNRTNGVLKRRSNSEAQHMRIDYWVNPEVETKEVVLGGTDVPHNRWTELAGTSFTATGFVPEQGAALPVLHIAELAVGWDRATHHAKYGVQIKLDGIVVSTLEETRVGPRYPWGEPYAKQVVSWSGQVMPNQKITFEVLSNDTVPGQRRLRDATRLVSYSKGV